MPSYLEEDLQELFLNIAKIMKAKLEVAALTGDSSSVFQDWKRQFRRVAIDETQLKTLKGSEDQTSDYFLDLTENQLKDEILDLCFMNFQGTQEHKQAFKALLMQLFHQGGLLNVAARCLAESLHENGFSALGSGNNIQIYSHNDGFIIRYDLYVDKIIDEHVENAEIEALAVEKGPILTGETRIDVRMEYDAHHQPILKLDLLSNRLDDKTVIDRLREPRRDAWGRIPDQWIFKIDGDLQERTKIGEYFSPPASPKP